MIKIPFAPAWRRAGLVLAGLCAAFTFSFAAFAAAPLSADQQAQIRAVVRQYLLDHPEVVEEAMKTLEARRAMARFRKIAADRRHFTVGPSNAKITIIEFFDYRCPHCKDSLAWTMKQVRQRKDVRVMFVELPILSPQSLEASQAAVASLKQGRYLAFHQALMKSRSALESKDIDSLARQVGLDVARLRRDMRDPAILALLQNNQETAEDAAIQGTPAYIINGKFFHGYAPDALDKGLREATSAAAKAAG